MLQYQNNELRMYYRTRKNERVARPFRYTFFDSARGARVFSILNTCAYVDQQCVLLDEHALNQLTEIIAQDKLLKNNVKPCNQDIIIGDGYAVTYPNRYPYEINTADAGFPTDEDEARMGMGDIISYQSAKQHLVEEQEIIITKVKRRVYGIKPRRW